MTHCVKHQLTSLILFCGLEDHHIHTKHKMPPHRCWHCVYLWPYTEQNRSPWGRKVTASSSSRWARLDHIIHCPFVLMGPKEEDQTFSPWHRQSCDSLLIGQGTEEKTDGWKTTRQREHEGGAMDSEGCGGREEQKTRIVCLRDRTANEGMLL